VSRHRRGSHGGEGCGGAPGAFGIVSNVSIKTLKEVNALRVACEMATETLHGVGEMIRAGITTDDINRFVHEDTLRRGGWPAPLNYHGFPKSVCTSVNEVVCHGIP